MTAEILSFDTGRPADLADGEPALVVDVEGYYTDYIGDKAVEYVDELSQGDVVIETAYSSVNYKDALAATGTGKISM